LAFLSGRSVVDSIARRHDVNADDVSAMAKAPTKTRRTSATTACSANVTSITYAESSSIILMSSGSIRVWATICPCGVAYGKNVGPTWFLWAMSAAEQVRVTT
jgi:hypothetical protein